MKTHFSLLAFCLLTCITGCKPTVIHVEPESRSEPETKTEIPPAVAESATEQPELKEATALPELARKEPVEPETANHVVLNEPWNSYFRSTPQILIVPKLSKGIADILNQEQELIRSVLDSGGDTSSSSEYIALEDKLEELKTVIPQSETDSGYVPRSSRRYGTYSYISGDTIYTNRRYYYGSYTILKEKTMSSSPELTRSVEGIAHNATLDDLDQRIDALQRILRQWSRKTSEMSPNGTSGIMRSANEAYLDGLREFTQEFTGLRSELRKIENRQQAILKNRAVILAEWKSFENTRLALLDEYLTANASETLSPSSAGIFEIPALENQKLIYACVIGARTLYFELTKQNNDLHPFVLVNVAPVQ
ncbi:MAG TPA: hypothetical protein DCX06_12510 [Opitutae bacterium]|mgnify:CR=1 FL=1|nr:hypothetical protein [Opitutae bacterium]